MPPPQTSGWCFGKTMLVQHHGVNGIPLGVMALKLVALTQIDTTVSTRDVVSVDGFNQLCPRLTLPLLWTAVSGLLDCLPFPASPFFFNKVPPRVATTTLTGHPLQTANSGWESRTARPLAAHCGPDGGTTRRDREKHRRFISCKPTKCVAHTALSVGESTPEPWNHA